MSQKICKLRYYTQQYSIKKYDNCVEVPIFIDMETILIFKTTHYKIMSLFHSTYAVGIQLWAYFLANENCQIEN